MTARTPVSRVLRSLAVLAGSAVLITGCATSNSGPQSEDAFNQSMSEAESALTSGQRDQAINLYEQIAKNNPTRQEPWSRIAQIQYSADRYPQAILAAEEALQRDANDRKAKSILAVSGLRVARRSVVELRADSALAGDVRSDAQLLARMLRDTLGEQVLFPKSNGDNRPAPPKRRVNTATAATTTTPATTAAPAAGKPAQGGAPAAGGSADPFGALR